MDTHYGFDKVDWEARSKALKDIGGSKKMTIFKMEFDRLVNFQRRSKYEKMWTIVVSSVTG